jgi:hypothetical protein
MSTLSTANGRLLAGLMVLAFALLVASGVAFAAPWDPAAFAKEDTLKLRTIGPKEGEYWFKVWLVVIDGQVYVRLGTRAAERVEANTTAPYLGVQVAGQRFDRVRGVPAPEFAERVAKAMADKYTSDIFVRFMSHPLTLRLVPEEPPAAAPAP